MTKFGFWALNLKGRILQKGTHLSGPLSSLDRSLAKRKEPSN